MYCIARALLLLPSGLPPRPLRRSRQRALPPGGPPPSAPRVSYHQGVPPIAASRSGARLQPHGHSTGSSGDAKMEEAIRSPPPPPLAPVRTRSDGSRRLAKRPEHRPHGVQGPGAAGLASERSRIPIPPRPCGKSILMGQPWPWSATSRTPSAPSAAQSFDRIFRNFFGRRRPPCRDKKRARGRPSTADRSRRRAGPAPLGIAKGRAS